ncbi:Poly [ADP-ribose] polymerase tankyrase-1 (ADP-ribosyltransferase diphtheria toxin-like 5) (ARTD5) (Protein poly-ADP-ribosyltransferase tankyrase-1) (TRF1-interacting ankyrin-related ADP-ribose polymerase 1) (Tankyrase I) (Tankyrase-1) (TANK1) [Durusdinium trenchii]|uniref:Uncharacterized protein n=1 Tax=Durusdinium trenchii TaxID=1381693 RepID=A0ABP0M958_9DINO
MPPVAYKRGWVASAPEDLLKDALKTAEAACEEASDPQDLLEVARPEEAWELQGDSWVLTLAAASASELTLDCAKEALRISGLEGDRSVSWPRSFTDEAESKITARFSKKQNLLFVTLPADLEASPAPSAPSASAKPKLKQAVEGGYAYATPQDAEAEDMAVLLMLHSSCALGDAAAVRRLLPVTKDVDALDELGATALEKACLVGHVEVAELLLAKGADAQGIQGAPSTPLHRAAALGDGPKTHRLLKLLLDHGANPNLKDSSGRLAADLFADAAGWQLPLGPSYSQWTARKDAMLVDFGAVQLNDMLTRSAIFIPLWIMYARIAQRSIQIGGA